MKALAAFVLMASPAFAVCDLDPAAAADLIDGDWTLRVVSSNITMGPKTRAMRAAPDTQMRVDMAQDGMGSLEISGSDVPLAYLTPGTFHLNGRGDRTQAFAELIGALEFDIATLPCPLVDVAQFRAEKTGEQGGKRGVALTDLVTLTPNMIAGIQFTRILQNNAPEISVMTQLRLTRP